LRIPKEHRQNRVKREKKRGMQRIRGNIEREKRPVREWPWKKKNKPWTGWRKRERKGKESQLSSGRKRQKWGVKVTLVMRGIFRKIKKEGE